MLRLKFSLKRKTSLLPSSEAGHIVIDHKKVAYALHRKPGKRRLTLYVEPSGRLRLIAPLRVKPLTIERFLMHSQNWVRGKLSELYKHPSPHFPAELAEGATLYYLGAPYSLAVRRDMDAPQSCAVSGARIEINLPSSVATLVELQEEIRLELVLWYKKQARRLLKERCEFWAAETGLNYRSLKITSPTRQWGSCSARNDVRLNWRVIMAPMEAIDYLIVHELAHVKHKNHSARFWNCVAQYVPNYKNLRQILKRMDAASTL